VRDRSSIFFPEQSSPAPQYIVAAAKLILLPWDYLSTRVCILDFDQAFLADDAPHKVPYLPVTYLAPESIFALTNSPAADVWALGCILFNLRYPMQLFWDVFANDAEPTAKTICYTLGPLPKECMAVLFLDGWPVHEPLEPDIQDKPEAIKLVDHSNDRCSLEDVVDKMREPLRPARSKNLRTRLENFCLRVPRPDCQDYAQKERFEAEHKTPIRNEDAKLFTDLLRKIFNYDHTKRITASQVLEHPWIRETG
jgi:serine/threonine protein kinase